MRFYEKSLFGVFFGEALANLFMLSALIQYEGAFSSMSLVAFRGHVVETCLLPNCLSLCDFFWGQLTSLSLNLLCKPNFSKCLNAL